MTKKIRPKIGLALGSGGSRGLAHIGVLEILEKNNIPIDYIAGSSIGAVVGGIYAATQDTKLLKQIFTSNSWKQIFNLLTDFSGLTGGLINGRKLADFLKKSLSAENFNDLLIPFAAVATDIETGETKILDKGDFISAIQASFSIPLLFKPLRREGKVLVDGGLTQPVPVRTVRKMGADIVIAVNLDKCIRQPKKYKNPHIPLLLGPMLDIARFHLAEKDSLLADIIISPKLNDSSLLGIENFLDGKDFITTGARATANKIPLLQKIIRQKNEL